MTQGKDILSFETTDQIPHQRGTKWTIGLVIAVLLGFLLSIWQESLSLGILSLSIALWYAVHYKKIPQKKMCIFSEHGIVFDKKWHYYQEIESFWIFNTEEDYCILHFLLKKNQEDISLIIPLEKKIIIQRILKNYISEDNNKTETTAEKLIRALKL